MLIRRAVKIVIFSPVIAPHAAAKLHRVETRDIRSPRSDVGYVIRSGVQACLVSSKKKKKEKEGGTEREHRDIQMPALLYGNTRDVKMTVRYAQSRRGDITSC